MKRILILFTLLIASVLAGVAQTRYVTTNLNLRYGPGTNYNVVTVLPKGTAVTIDDDCDCKWVPVSYNGQIGYIRTSYLSRNKVGTYSNRSTGGSNYRTRSYTRNNSVRYYTNRYGNRVQSPTYYNSRPAGATALCRDGTYSFSQSHRGTCSHHGGVAQWYR